MPTSIRQQIVDAVKTRMEGILTSAGYQTDIGQKVVIWNPLPINDTRIHGIHIMDAEDNHDEKLSNHQEHDLLFVLDVHAKQGADTAAYLRNAIADIWRAIGTDRFWTVADVKLAKRGTKAISDKILFDQTGKITGAARVQFLVQYRTQSFNPFAHQA